MMEIRDEQTDKIESRECNTLVPVSNQLIKIQFYKKAK